MKHFFVVCQERCTDCGGTGIITDPTGLWAEYAKFEKALKKTSIAKHDPEFADENAKAIFDWWANHGYGNREWGDFAPEEEPCGSCDGAGVTRSEVPLQDAMAELVGSAPAMSCPGDAIP